VETSVQIPVGGAVTIGEKTIVQPNPPGFSLLGQQVNISGPGGAQQQPLVIIFWLDNTLLTEVTPTTVQVFKNGALVPNCNGPTGKASPDPCVASRSVLTGDQAGDLRLVIQTSDASSWNFGVSIGTGVLVGDVDCNGVVDPVDAALILQFVAGMVNSLPCPQNGDVDENGSTASTDAALILQFSAGIIDSLPPNAASAGWPSFRWLAGLGR